MDPTTADARNRAWRTLVQGLGIDILAGLALVLAPAVSTIEWTPVWWTALGLLAAKSVVQSVVSYIARKAVPPIGS